MKRLEVRGSRGFTLVELMIVVVVMGVLAAIAIPQYSRYVRRSRTSEAMGNIAKIYQGQITYRHTAQERSSSSTFVNAPALPAAAPGAAKYPPNVTIWASSLEWSAIGFGLDGAHYYQYVSPGDATSFSARALGNLDGDATLSTFERAGTVAAGGEVQGGVTVISNELE